MTLREWWVFGFCVDLLAGGIIYFGCGRSVLAFAVAGIWGVISFAHGMRVGRG